METDQILCLLTAMQFYFTVVTVRLIKLATKPHENACLRELIYRAVTSRKPNLDTKIQRSLF